MVTGNRGLIRKNALRNLLFILKTLAAKAGYRLLLFSWEVLVLKIDWNGGFIDEVCIRSPFST